MLFQSGVLSCSLSISHTWNFTVWVLLCPASFTQCHIWDSSILLYVAVIQPSSLLCNISLHEKKIRLPTLLASEPIPDYGHCNDAAMNIRASPDHIGIPGPWASLSFHSRRHSWALSKVASSIHAPHYLQQLLLSVVLMLAVLVNVHASPPWCCFAFPNTRRSNTHPFMNSLDT